MQVISGEKISNSILDDLREKINKEEAKPGLAVILAGEDRASQIYVGLKEKAAKKVGIHFNRIEFRDGESPRVLEEKIVSKIQNLNTQNQVDGIIVQLPLPGSLDAQRIISTIDPYKDVDGFHPDNVGLFFDDREYIWPVFPKSIIRMIEATEENLDEKIAYVIANSEKFGEVMAKALNKRGIRAQYVLTVNLKSSLNEIKDADIIVTACGVPGLIKGDMIKDGAIVIDGGITKIDKKILGDVDFESIKNKRGYISPVPGGVGPVTVANLMENVYLASKL